MTEEKAEDVVFVVDDNLATLADFRYKRKYVAKNGENGRAHANTVKKRPTLKSKCRGVLSFAKQIQAQLWLI